MTESPLHIVKRKHNAPAFHYLFFNSNTVLNEVCQGFQQVENNLEVNGKTSFHAFSVTKTITAVAVMQLIGEGKIKLDEHITRYLPDYTFSKPVTVRNLLCHQSGIANPLPLKWTHLADEHGSFDYRKFSDSMILNHLKLKSAPGKKYAYSNIDYLVLGRLIEEICHQKYQDYIVKNILNHLPTKKYIGFDIPETNHATGYHANTWFQNVLLGYLLDRDKMMYRADDDWSGFNSFYTNGAPFGGIISSPGALMTFCQALLNGDEALLSKSQVQEMLTPQKTNNGKKTKMCLGWFTGTIDGLVYYCHAGGGGGYYSEIRLYPDLGYGSMIMLNSSGMKDERILDLLDTGISLSNKISV